MSDPYANDPYIGVRASDDPESRALKQGFALLVWPRPMLLAVGWLALFLLGLGWLKAPLLFLSCVWLAAQLIVRPSKFGAEIGLMLGWARDGFGAVAKWLADRFAPVLAKWNAAHHERRKAKEAEAVRAAAQPMMMAEVAASEPMLAMGSSAPDETPAPKRQRRSIDWLDVAEKLFDLRLWAFLAVAAAILFVANGCFSNPLAPPSGREVAAEYRADWAEAKERTAGAEADMRERVVIRVEERNTAVQRIGRERERAREAIRSAPDLEARIAVHRDLAERMRDEAAQRRAAAMSDYNTSLDP